MKKYSFLLKKAVCVFAVVLLAFSVVVPISGITETYGDFEYKVEDGYLTITKYIGTATDVVIPEKINNYDVNYILLEIFNDTQAESITIPSSVSAIYTTMSEGECNLSSITVATDNERYCSVNGVLFDKEMTEIVFFPPKMNELSYSIPEGISKIGYGCFEQSGYLTELNIPSTVTEISDDVFDSLNLQAINVDSGNGFYSSQDGVLFMGNEQTLLRYPAGKSGFEYAIPNTVREIGNSAFKDCKSLTTLYVPTSVVKCESIYLAFFGCDNLFTLNYAGTKEQLENIGIDLSYYTGLTVNYNVPAPAVQAAPKTTMNSINNIEETTQSFNNKIEKKDNPEDESIVDFGAQMLISELRKSE